MVERRLIAVEGTVQGVGFRPYVHRLAAANHLRGLVRNGGAGVLIDVEGELDCVDAFCEALSHAPPPLATIANAVIMPPIQNPRMAQSMRPVKKTTTNATAMKKLEPQMSRRRDLF